ncbi:hypothetical protein BY458DRAFT_494271 [Sporodiniella umbellata]|nr:hypothetical protein BY458DRAFT_494271 [Sporodiniella umbellata]
MRSNLFITLTAACLICASLARPINNKTSLNTEVQIERSLNRRVDTTSAFAGTKSLEPNSVTSVGANNGLVDGAGSQVHDIAHGTVNEVKDITNVGLPDATVNVKTEKSLKRRVDVSDTVHSTTETANGLVNGAGSQVHDIAHGTVNEAKDTANVGLPDAAVNVKTEKSLKRRVDVSDTVHSTTETANGLVNGAGSQVHDIAHGTVNEVKDITNVGLPDAAVNVKTEKSLKRRVDVSDTVHSTTETANGLVNGAGSQVHDIAHGTVNEAKDTANVGLPDAAVNVKTEKSLKRRVDVSDTVHSTTETANGLVNGAGSQVHDIAHGTVNEVKDITNVGLPDATVNVKTEKSLKRRVDVSDTVHSTTETANGLVNGAGSQVHDIAHGTVNEVKDITNVGLPDAAVNVKTEKSLKRRVDVSDTVHSTTETANGLVNGAGSQVHDIAHGTVNEAKDTANVGLPDAAVNVKTEKSLKRRVDVSDTVHSTTETANGLVNGAGSQVHDIAHGTVNEAKDTANVGLPDAAVNVKTEKPLKRRGGKFNQVVGDTLDSIGVKTLLPRRIETSVDAQGINDLKQNTNVAVESDVNSAKETVKDTVSGITTGEMD